MAATQTGKRHAFPRYCYKLLIRGLELAQDLVAPLHRVVERGLRRLLPLESCFQLLLDHRAPLHEVAEAQAFGVRRGRLVGKLPDGGVATRILVVEAGLA